MGQPAESGSPPAWAAHLPHTLTLGGLLGRGGMGEVYAADHAQHGEVVVKVMHAHLDPRNKERLELEAHALHAVVSPYVVRVLEWGTAGDQPFLVMERLQGSGLDVMLKQGLVRCDDALRITRDLLLGLDAVHQRKLVHRDIKPGNVFVCGNRAVLLDFGIVKLLQQVTGISPLQNPTATGVAVGTPRYMSPEQSKGEVEDGATDQYAVAMMLFRMVTGEHVFPHKQLSALLLAHLQDEPRSASSIAPQPLRPGFDELVFRALQKDPADRFPSAEAFATAVEALVPGLSSSRLSHQDKASASPAFQTEILEIKPARTPGGTVRMGTPQEALDFISQRRPQSTDKMVERPSTERMAQQSDGAPFSYVVPTEVGVPVLQAPAATTSTRRWSWLLLAVLTVLVFMGALFLAEALL